MTAAASVQSSSSPVGEGARRRLLWLIIAVYVLYMLDRQIIAILLEPIRHEFSLTDAQLGILSGLAYSAAGLVAGLPAGLLVDRFPRKAILSGALVLWSALTALCGLAPTFPLLLLGRMGVGAAEAAGPVASLSMLSDAYPPERRATVTGLMFASGGVGAILSFTLGGWIAASFGWRAAFLAAAAPGLVLVLLLIWFMREPARPAADVGAPRPGVATSWRALCASRGLALLVVGIPLVAVGLPVLSSWGASLLIRQHAFSIGQAGLAMSVCAGLFAPAGQLLGGWLGDRLSPRLPAAPLYLVAGSAIFGASATALAANTEATMLALAGLFVGAFSSAMWIGPSYGHLMRLSPPASRGALMALAGVLANLAGYGAGPVLVGFLSDAMGGPASLGHALPIALICPIAGAVLYLVLAGRLRRGA